MHPLEVTLLPSRAGRGECIPQPLVSAVSLLCFLPLSGNSGRYFPETGRQAVRAQSKVFPRAPRERACRESLRGSQGGPPPPEKVLLSPGGLGTERQQLGQGHPGGDCPHAKGQPPPTLEPRDSEGLSEQNAAQRTLPTQLTSGPGQKRPAFPWTHKSRGPSTPLQPWHPGVGRRRHDEGATTLESPVSSPQTGKPVQWGGQLQTCPPGPWEDTSGPGVETSCGFLTLPTPLMKADVH